MGTETGIEMGKIRIVDKNELVEKGKGIYKKIKDRLKPAHKGEVIAIEVKDYSLGNSVIEADRKARGRYPARYSISVMWVIAHYTYAGEEKWKVI